MTVYYPVDDLKKSLKPLVDTRAKASQEIKDVGGGCSVDYSMQGIINLHSARICEIASARLASSLCATPAMV